MATQKSSRYALSITGGGDGLDKGTIRDSGEVTATNDDEAWGKAHTWAAENALSEDGDYLQMTKDGVGIKGTALRKIP
jgi:hypothetical protein